MTHWWYSWYSWYSRKKFSINSIKAKKNIYLSLHYDYDNRTTVVCLKMENKFNFKATNCSCLSQLLSGSIYEKFGNVQFGEISFK